MVNCCTQSNVLFLFFFAPQQRSVRVFGGTMRCRMIQLRYELIFSTINTRSNVMYIHNVEICRF